LKLVNEFGIRSFPSYYIFRNGEVLHSIQGHHDAFFLADWYDEAVGGKISKTKYISDITPMISPDMIKYIDEVKAEMKITRERLIENITKFQIALEEPNTNNVLNTLHNNPFFFDFIIKGSYMVRNFRFGNNFLCDFMIFGINKNDSNTGIRAVFIKAENHQQTVFNNDDNLNESLDESLRIVEKWKDWLSVNNSYINNVIVDFLKTKQEIIRSEHSMLGLYSKLLTRMANRPVTTQYLIIAGRASKTTKDVCVKQEKFNHITDSVFVYNYNVFIEKYIHRKSP
jgi:hypothetical protein